MHYEEPVINMSFLIILKTFWKIPQIQDKY